MNPPRRRRGRCRLAARALCAAALLAPALAGPAAAELARVAAGADPCLRVRAEPELGSAMLACLPPGTTVELLRSGAVWSEAQLEDGTRGWVVSEFLVADARRVAGSEEPAATPGAPPPSPAPMSPTQPPTAPPTPPQFTRIEFDIPFPEERGGGSAVGSAESVQTQGDSLVVAAGGVEIKYRDMVVQARRIEVDRATRELVAEGEVILDQGPRRLTGTRLEFNLDTRTGRMVDAEMFADPDIYFTGRQVQLLGDDLYSLDDGEITSCFNDRPAWSFRTAGARVRLEGLARIRHTRMRVKGAPVFYLPYMIVPAKSDRAAGLLFPNFGSSQERGSYVGLAYFQPFGPSYDATLFLDLYSEDYTGFGTEVRYRPEEATTGWFEGYAIEDPLADETRWKLSWDHSSDELPLGFRGVLRLRDYSDFNFFADFERDFNNATLRRIESTGFLAGNWGAHTLNILVNENQAFIGNSTVTGRQLPEVEYRLRSRQFGEWPLFLELLTSLNRISINRSGVLSAEYSRVDVYPQLTVPLSTLPWLSVSLTGGQRVTYYEKSVEPGVSGIEGGSLTRTFETASAQVIGPSVSRIFDKKIGRFARFKHIVEPRWGYGYVSDFDDQNLVPRFDEVDILNPREIAGWALVNRLLAKPADEELFGGPREILSFELRQSFSLDDAQPLQRSRDGTRSTTEGPLGALLRFNPSTRVSVEARADYSTLFGNLQSTSLSSILGFGRQSFGLSWYTRYNAESGEETSDQIRLSANLQLLPERLRLGTQVSYDILADLVQQDAHSIVYTGQCWGVRLDLVRFRSLQREDYDVRFALTLKNIGTFLDLTGGTRGSRY